MAILDITQHIDVLKGICQFTGNPKKDVGYLCSNTCPYFKFRDDEAGDSILYTLLPPSRGGKKAYTINVYYEFWTKLPDGTTGTKMQLAGTVTTRPNQDGQGYWFIFEDLSYEYTMEYEDIALHTINIWSKRKPIAVNIAGILTEEQFRLYNYGLSPTKDNQGYASRGYSYIPPTLENTMYKRLWDFHGYNDAAQCPAGDLAEVFPAQVSILSSPGILARGVDMISVNNKSNPTGYAPNVEIPFDALCQAGKSNNYYLGYLFVRQGQNISTGFIHLTQNRLVDAVNNFYMPYEQALSFTEAGWNAGYTIEVHVVSVEVANMNDDTQMMYRPVPALGQINFHSYDHYKQRGFTTFVTKGYTYIFDQKQMVLRSASGFRLSYNGSESSGYTFSAAFIDLQDQYVYKTDDRVDAFLTMRLYIGTYTADGKNYNYGTSLKEKNTTYSVAAYPFSIYVDPDTLRDDNYEVPVEVEVIMYQRTMRNDDSWAYTRKLTKYVYGRWNVRQSQFILA